MAHPGCRRSAQLSYRQGRWYWPTQQAAFEGERRRVAGLGREGGDRPVIAWYRAGARSEHEAPAARGEYQLVVAVDLDGGGLLVVRSWSGELQQMRASQRLSAIKSCQSDGAGYSGAELKISAVPAEGGGLDDLHRCGVELIHQP